MKKVSGMSSFPFQFPSILWLFHIAMEDGPSIDDLFPARNPKLMRDFPVRYVKSPNAIAKNGRISKTSHPVGTSLNQQIDDFSSYSFQFIEAFPGFSPS